MASFYDYYRGVPIHIEVETASFFTRLSTYIMEELSNVGDAQYRAMTDWRILVTLFTLHYFAALFALLTYNHFGRLPYLAYRTVVVIAKLAVFLLTLFLRGLLMMLRSPLDLYEWALTTAESLTFAVKVPLANHRNSENKGLVPESYKEGSEFFFAAVPRGQFSLYVGDPTQPNSQLVGHGCRLEDELHAPIHVLNAGPDYLAVVKTDGLQHKLLTVMSIKGLKWVEYMSDMAKTPNPNQHIPKVTVAPLYNTVAGNIASGHAQNNASVGLVHHDIFGYLRYEGSTRPGFSGALLMYNNSAVGMHVGGGQKNVAVSLDYAALTSRKYVEETEEFVLRGALSKGHWDRLQFSVHAPDEVSFKYHGKYYNIDRQTYKKYEGYYHRGIKPEPAYDDECASGNPMAASGKNCPEAAPGQPQRPDVPPTMESSQSPAREASSGPSETPQPSAGPSRPTLNWPTTVPAEPRPSQTLILPMPEPLSPPLIPSVPSTVLRPTSNDPDHLIAFCRSSQPLICEDQRVPGLLEHFRRLANRSGTTVSALQIRQIFENYGCFSENALLLSREELYMVLKTVIQRAVFAVPATSPPS